MTVRSEHTASTRRGSCVCYSPSRMSGTLVRTIVAISLLMVLAACNSSTHLSGATVSVSELLNMTMSDLESRYGRGEVESCRCYSDGRTYAEFCEDEDDERRRMWRVTFSRDPVCSMPRQPMTRLPVPITPNGVRIGDFEDVLFSREGREYSLKTPSQLRVSQDGPLTAEQLERLGDVEYQFSSYDKPVLSVFARNGRVTALAAWISD